MKKVLAFILAVVMIMMTSSSAFAQASTPKRYSGEQVFRGLVFGQGEVAALFPTIWTKDLLSKVNNKQTAAAVDVIAANVKQLDSNYFNVLEKAVYSGNYVQVRAALTRGGELIEQAVKNVQVTNPQLGTGTGDCLTIGYFVYAGAVFQVAAAVNYAVLATAGGAVTVYLVVVAGKYFWTSSVNPQEGTLKQDMLVSSVVKAFAK